MRMMGAAEEARSCEVLQSVAYCELIVPMNAVSPFEHKLAWGVTRCRGKQKNKKPFGKHQITAVIRASSGSIQSLSIRWAQKSKREPNGLWDQRAGDSPVKLCSKLEGVHFSVLTESSCWDPQCCLPLPSRGPPRHEREDLF